MLQVHVVCCDIVEGLKFGLLIEVRQASWVCTNFIVCCYNSYISFKYTVVHLYIVGEPLGNQHYPDNYIVATLN